jgi:outer membrane lipoprotein-sorting protein
MPQPGIVSFFPITSRAKKWPDAVKGCGCKPLWALLAVVLSFGGAAAVQAQQTEESKAAEARANSYEPRAMRLLQQMADAYSHLTLLEQETEYTSALTPLVPVGPESQPPARKTETESNSNAAEGPDAEQKLDRRLRLSFAAPNRLRMEIEEKDENGKAQISQWVSDGKLFWTYSPEKNLYSKEKAPGKIQDFARLPHMSSGSLEMLMLMGINPFAQIEEQAGSVRYGGTDNVRGTAADVVIMNADAGPQITETRLYIGAEDHLLYRLVSETAQKIKPPDKRQGVGSPLDELAAPTSPPPLPLNPGEQAPVPGIPMKSRVTVENHMRLAPIFDGKTFAYAPPEGALFLNTPDPHRKPPTLKQRLAELAKTYKRSKKQSPPRVLRF